MKSVKLICENDRLFDRQRSRGQRGIRRRVARGALRRMEPQTGAANKETGLFMIVVVPEDGRVKRERRYALPYHRVLPAWTLWMGDLSVRCDSRDKNDYLR